MQVHELYSSQSTPRNQLLGSLPLDVFERLSPSLHFTSLGKGQTLLKRGDSIPAIYFLNGGLCSMTTTMEDGGTVEIARVSCRGFVGHEALSDGGLALCDASVAVAPESAYMLSLDAFRAEIARRGPFEDAVGAYMNRFSRVVMQSAACVALHSADQRTARWLLDTSDQLSTSKLAVTQEAIAAALGVRRPTVTLVLNAFAKESLIEIGRGQIRITDRAGLDRSSCECSRMPQL